MHDEKEMTFLEHLEEMRGVILRCVAAFTVAFICVLIGFHYFNNLMMYPLNSAKRIIAMWVEPSPDDIKAEDQKLGPVYLVGTQKGADGEAVKQGPFFIVPTQNGIVLKPQSDSGSDWYNAIKLRSMSFTTPLVIWFYVGFLGAIGFSMPIMLYFVARFIAPGLKPEELKMLRPGMIAGIILFAIGICFGFMFILPMGIAFMSFMSQSMSLEMFPDAQSYYSMVIFVTLAIGLTFQLPLLEVILIYLGVLNVEWLKKNRKIAFFCILLFATVVTPPDVFTQVSITVPLYIMYEGALVIGARLRKKKLEKERQEEILQAEEDERERREYAQMVARERLEEKREAESYESGDYGDISGVEDMEIDKTVYGDRASDEYDNTYDNYPYDPSNLDDPNYDPDNDPYAVEPYINYGRAARYAPDFGPDWELNREDTSFMTPDWSLNAEEPQPNVEQGAEESTAGADSGDADLGGAGSGGENAGSEASVSKTPNGETSVGEISVGTPSNGEPSDGKPSNGETSVGEPSDDETSSSESFGGENPGVQTFESGAEEPDAPKDSGGHSAKDGRRAGFDSHSDSLAGARGKTGADFGETNPGASLSETGSRAEAEAGEKPFDAPRGGGESAGGKNPENPAR